MGDLREEIPTTRRATHLHDTWSKLHMSKDTCGGISLPEVHMWGPPPFRPYLHP